MSINGKMQHPAVPTAIIVMLATLTVAGFVSFTDLEKQVQATENGLSFERQLRQISTENIKENLEQLKKDTEKIREEMGEGNKEIKDLLKQLILERKIP